MGNEDIYISINIDSVQDWEHQAPIDVTLNVVIVNKEELKEETFKVGDLVDLFFYLEV